MMCINENVKNQMALHRLGKQLVELAHGQRGKYEVVGPLEMVFLNRSTSCRAMVLPGDSEILEAIPFT